MIRKHSRLTAVFALVLVLAGLFAYQRSQAITMVLDSNISPQVISASGAAQTNTATLAATAGRTQFLEGFDLTGGGATSASVIEVSITGLSGGTLKYEVAIQAGATAPAFGTTGQGSTFQVRFPQALPASAVNTAISIAVPSYGAGNTNAGVIAYGYLK